MCIRIICAFLLLNLPFKLLIKAFQLQVDSFKSLVDVPQLLVNRLQNLLNAFELLALLPPTEFHLLLRNLTDGFLIYAPSQIALAAVIHAASKNKINLDSYVTQQLFDSQGQEAITHIVTIVRNIRVLVKNIPEPSPEKDKELIKALCLKVFISMQLKVPMYTFTIRR